MPISERPYFTQSRKYQQIQREVKKLENSKLAEIVTEYKPKIERRERHVNTFVSFALPLIIGGFVFSLVTRAGGYDELSKESGLYTGVLLLGGAVAGILYEIYSHTGKRKIERYKLHAAESAFEEREK